MPETTMSALKKFFHTPPLSMTEIKALSKEERGELVDLIFAETGWERQVSA